MSRNRKAGSGGDDSSGSSGSGSGGDDSSGSSGSGSGGGAGGGGDAGRAGGGRGMGGGAEGRAGAPVDPVRGNAAPAAPRLSRSQEAATISRRWGVRGAE